MLSLFKMSKPIKGYKITDNKRSRKFGIGANSLKMLKDKAKKKFPIEDCRLYLAADGFEVSDEDYFQTIEAQTLFIVAGPDDDIVTDPDFEFSRIKNQSPLLQVADIIQDFIERNPDKFRELIMEYERRNRMEQEKDKTHLSLRSDHIEWFEGQEERCNSKEEAMARRAQDRIRGYYYKTKEEISRSKIYRTNLKAREAFDKILGNFRFLLIGCNHFSMLFDRNCEHRHDSIAERSEDDTDAVPLPSKRMRQVVKEHVTKTELLAKWSVALCTESGDFYCQGAFSEGQACNKKHSINPYTSRENLILFQVWNLDHQIELSRSVIPSLIEHVREFVENPKQKCPQHKRKVVGVSVLEYFLEIFSLKNLKLVHIVCHEKVQRSNKSNGRLVCDKCDEYQLIKELEDISCPDEADSWLEQ